MSAKAISEEVAQLWIAAARSLFDDYRIHGLWSISDVARWFEVSPRKARDLVLQPGFPKVGRIPSRGKGSGDPRWVGFEVVQWDDWTRNGPPPPVADWSDSTEHFALAEFGGVYVLMLGGLPQYVGQSRHIARRISQHVLRKIVRFDSVRFVRIDDAGDRLAKERDLILELVPPMQGAGNRKAYVAR